MEPHVNFKFMKEVLREKWAADEFFSYFLSELKIHKWFYNWTEQAERDFYFFYKKNK